MPRFNVMHWPDGTDPENWQPVAQGVEAASNCEAVEMVTSTPGRYRTTLADKPGMTGGGLVRVDQDGTAHDVDAF
jgi:hypothetical protein